MSITFNLLKMDVLTDHCASLGLNSGNFSHISDCSFQERVSSMKVVRNKVHTPTNTLLTNLTKF